MAISSSLVRHHLGQLRTSKTPVRDLYAGMKKAVALVFRAPDGVLFSRLAWNSPTRSSSDFSYPFKVENAVRSALRLPFNFNFSKIEIELTTLCNLRCNNCDRSSGQAISSEMMSVDQVEHFIQESIAHRKKWRKIVIQGGEPLLHPEIDRILAMFVEYKRGFSPGTFIRITTNGYGPKVQKVIERVPPEIFVLNTAKIPISNEGHIKITGRPEPEFDTYHIAPVDVVEYEGFDDEDYKKGCRIPQTCGMALTRYGYFPCGAGASVARVFGLNVGVKSLSQVTRQQFRGSLGTLCRYCGHFKNKGRVDLPASVPVTSPDQVSSASWRAALETFRDKKEQLTLY